MVRFEVKLGDLSFPPIKCMGASYKSTIYWGSVVFSYMYIFKTFFICMVEVKVDQNYFNLK